MGVTLTVNGSTRVVPENTTLAQLLVDLGLEPRMIVVEHNRTILHDRERYASIVLQEGDVLELVHFVGGG
jgi:thiamine biosynthesis protein ThiS